MPRVARGCAWPMVVGAVACMKAAEKWQGGVSTVLAMVAAKCARRKDAVRWQSTAAGDVQVMVEDGDASTPPAHAHHKGPPNSVCAMGVVSSVQPQTV
mmetsp:Transcript_11325/g.16707  ORF Transcript_11325/g.16707 Transcript_11325/m.16707 type:complete len:98 (-) Transcript_11325:378-671(-)